MSHKAQIESELPFAEHYMDSGKTAHTQRPWKYKEKKSYSVQFMAGEVKHRDLKDHLPRTYQIQHIF